MSRESLLDEAITKAKEAKDWQLVEWLRMARGGESAARWYSDKLREAHRTERKLQDENARLRSCLSDDAENARMIMGENAKLREQIHWLKQGDILHVLTDQEYIDQCERERLMQVSIDALDKENAELRELILELYEDQCDECDRWKYRDRMRELGVVE